MFAIGDQIVHPMHGAGIIEDVVERTVKGVAVRYYALKPALENVLLYVPVEHSREIGMRAVCSPERAREILEILPQIGRDEDQTWNRRFRENMLRIRSGEIQEVARVVVNLARRAKEHGLSAGEKQLYGSARHILVSELALALSQSVAEIEKTLERQIGA